MRKLITFGIALLILITLVSAVTITQSGSFGNFVLNVWNTSNSQETLTFTGGENQTLYLRLPKYINVTHAQIFLNSTDNLNNLSLEVGTPDGTNEYFFEGEFNSSEIINTTNRFNNPSFESPISGNDWIYSELEDTGNSSGQIVTESGWHQNNAYFLFVTGNAGAVKPYAEITQPIDLTYIENITFMAQFSLDDSRDSFQFKLNNSVLANITNSFSKTNLSYDVSNYTGSYNVTIKIIGRQGASDSVSGKVDQFRIYKGNNTPNINPTIFNSYLNSCSAVGGYCDVPFIFNSKSAGDLVADVGHSINYSLLYNFTYDNETIEENSNLYNLTVPSGNITSATLWFNNSGYPATVGSPSSAYINLNPFEVPTGLNYTASMFWELDQGNTTESNQTVHKINLFECSESSSIHFIIKNEEDGSNLTGDLTADFDLWYFPGFNRSYFFDLAGNHTYEFCKTPAWANYTTNALIQYGATGYFNRNYYLNDLITSTQQEITLYLLNESSDTTIFTIYDYDATSTTLEDVFIVMERYVNGSWVQVDTKLSDISGKAQFGYVPLMQYRFTLTKDGYNENSFELNPILFSTYDIKMTKSVLLNYSQDYDGLSITYSPAYFNNNAVTLFTFNIYSPGETLLYYGYNLTYPGGNNTNWGNTSSGGQLFSSVNISNAGLFDTVNLTYFYETEYSGLREHSILIIIDPNNESENTFVKNRSETYGLGIFERMLIMTLIILFIVGIAALIGQPIPGLGLAALVFGYMVYIGFIPIWSVLPSMLIMILYISWKSGG